MFRWGYALTVPLLFVAGTAVAQTTIGSLPVKHANAIQSYIAKYPSLEFLSEYSYPRDDLAYIRNEIDKNLKPYYRTGDFNFDKRPDFAVVLAKGTSPKRVGDGDGPHAWEHHLTVVVFNGQKDRGYKAVFVKSIQAPLVSFLYRTFEKKPRLTFGTAETDSGFIISPAGNGYVAEYDDHSAYHFKYAGGW